MPLIYIIILNYNSYRDTIECINSLSKIKYENYKIIVIDNNSNDNSKEEILKTLPHIQIIETKKNLGFAGGNNIGIQCAIKNGADYILLINNDTVSDERFLDFMVDTFRKYKDAGIVSCKIKDYSNPKILGYAGGVINWFKFNCDIIGENMLDSREFDIEKEVSYATGCCMLIKRDVISKVGYLPEEYFMYFEDVDFSIKSIEAGFKIYYTPQAIIYHKGSGSSGGADSPFAIKWCSRNRIIFMSKYRNKVSISSFILSNIFFYSTRIPKLALYYMKMDTKRSKAMCEGIKEGIKYIKNDKKFKR